jgi:hypothetical protein
MSGSWRNQLSRTLRPTSASSVDRLRHVRRPSDRCARDDDHVLSVRAIRPSQLSQRKIVVGSAKPARRSIASFSAVVCGSRIPLRLRALPAISPFGQSLTTLPVVGDRRCDLLAPTRSLPVTRNSRFRSTRSGSWQWGSASSTTPTGRRSRVSPPVSHRHDRVWPIRDERIRGLRLAASDPGGTGSPTNPVALF